MELMNQADSFKSIQIQLNIKSLSLNKCKKNYNKNISDEENHQLC